MGSRGRVCPAMVVSAAGVWALKAVLKESRAAYKSFGIIRAVDFQKRSAAMAENRPLASGIKPMEKR